MPKRQEPRPGPHPSLTNQPAKGRPKAVMHVSLTTEAKDMVAELARDEGASISGLLERWIRERWKRRA